jgi:protein-S-isoprenylcysteine O-methyltransferase Ste14
MKQVLGYLLGFVLFIVGIPVLMWWASGSPFPWDAYNHELASRTKHLMTDGPYKYTRNPMLVGIYIYDIGVLLWLQSWWPLLVFSSALFSFINRHKWGFRAKGKLRNFTVVILTIPVAILAMRLAERSLKKQTEASFQTAGR